MKRRTHLPSSCHQDSQQLSAAGVNTKTCLAAELMTLHQVWSLQPVNKHGMAVGKCLDSRLFALLNVGNCKKKMHVFLDHLPICRQEIAIFEWRCPPFLGSTAGPESSTVPSCTKPLHARHAGRQAASTLFIEGHSHTSDGTGSASVGTPSGWFPLRQKYLLFAWTFMKMLQERGAQAVNKSFSD